jgi:hypothetical protein
MHKEGVCASKWTKIDHCLEAVFSKNMKHIAKTKQKNKNYSHFQMGIFGFLNMLYYYYYYYYYYYCSKSQYHTQICLNKKTNKKN